MQRVREFFAAIPDPLLAIIIVVAVAVIAMRVISSASDLTRFFGWCAVLAGLAFYWIVSGNEIIGWGCLGWIAYGIWRIKADVSEAEVQRTQEFREQFLPGSATEEQLRYIRILCKSHDRELPPNLDEMSGVEAKGLISELTGKVVEL